MQAGVDAAEVKRRLKATTDKYRHGVNVSVSSITSTRLDFEERNLEHVVRASVHYYNTETELEDFVETLQRVLA